MTWTKTKKTLVDKLTKEQTDVAIEMYQVKICNDCNVEKSTEDFTKRDKQSNICVAYCKECVNKRASKYRKTKQGLLSLVYRNQVLHSKNRGHTAPEYNMHEFKGKYINDETYLALYDEWVTSGYNKKLTPSFDRLDDNKGYSFSNLNRWMTWMENNEKGWSSSKKKVKGIRISDNKEFIFDSMVEASELTGCRRQGVSMCCRGVRDKAGGFKWSYLQKIF